MTGFCGVKRLGFTGGLMESGRGFGVSLGFALAALKLSFDGLADEGYSVFTGF